MIGLVAAKTLGDRVFNTRNTLPVEARVKLCVLLNQRLADAIDLDTQTKHAHWNVKGPHFIALHLLFDEVYNAIEQYVDLLAERVVQLGGVAGGTARMAAGLSMLTEYPPDMVGGTEHVNALASALAQFGGHMRDTITQVIALRDQDTADICTEISRGVDKHLWLVEAHVQTRTNGHWPPTGQSRRNGDEPPAAAIGLPDVGALVALRPAPNDGRKSK